MSTMKQLLDEIGKSVSLSNHLYIESVVYLKLTTPHILLSDKQSPISLMRNTKYQVLHNLSRCMWNVPPQVAWLASSAEL